MNKHVPEWHLENGANSHIFDGRVLNGSGACVAFVHLDTEECHLIAAAPDLLAALTALADNIARLDEEGLAEHAEQMIAARAAIAKANL